LIIDKVFEKHEKVVVVMKHKTSFLT